jgi:hypothetical protein
MTLPVPLPRWGVRFTSNPAKDKTYLQGLYDNDATAAGRGELFLNEVKEELYYVGEDGVARKVESNTPVLFSRIDFTGLREFANDAAAAAATPAVPIGGMYHTAGTLKVRRS